MPRLFGTQEWNQAVLQEKVAYLLGSMADASELALAFRSSGIREGFARNEDVENEARDVRLEQFTEAVTLLLVSDLVAEAKSLFRDPGWVLSGRPALNDRVELGEVETNIRQFVRLTLFATLARQGRMRIISDELVFGTDRGSLRLTRKAESDPELTSVLPTLYSIAVASESENETLRYLADRISGAWEESDSDLFDRAEFQLLGIYGIAPMAHEISIDLPQLFTRFNGTVALRELERNYATRIRQMRKDTYHWERLNPAGDLIDWVLLITQVAVIRQTVSPFPWEQFNPTPEARFCWELARAFE